MGFFFSCTCPLTQPAPVFFPQQTHAFFTFQPRTPGLTVAPLCRPSPTCHWTRHLRVTKEACHPCMLLLNSRSFSFPYAHANNVQSPATSLARFSLASTREFLSQRTAPALFAPTLSSRKLQLGEPMLPATVQLWSAHLPQLLHVPSWLISFPM